MSLAAYSEKWGGSTMSSLFESIWFQFLCVACTTYCFWQLCLLISPVKAALIRALRVWIEAQDGTDHLHQARESAFGSRTYTIPHDELPKVPQLEDASLSTEILLGSKKNLSKKDLLRGLLCSSAAYLDNGAVENLFKQAQQEFPTLDQFEKVHTSVDHDDWKCRYLVAYAADAIFIAFRGTLSLVDVADELTITKSSSGHGGKFHEGYLKRSESFLGPNNKLDALLQSGKRIILCGHSMGGAVAHMVLLRYLLEKDLRFTLDNPGPPDSLFSIAFGAPHVCDRLAAGIINEDECMKWRFINFVNQADPVPRFLHHLASTLMTFLKEAPAYFTNSDSILAQFGGFTGVVISGYATGRVPDWRGMARQVGGAIVAHSWKKYIDECYSTRRSKLRMFCDWAAQDGVPNSEFHPVGQYVFLTRRRPVSEGDEWGPWKHNIEHGQNREMTELRIRDSVQYCDFENHTFLSYKTALIKTHFLDSPREYSIITTSRNSVQRNLIVSTPSPVIINAWLDTSAPEHLLSIKGQNLLFLYEPIKFNDDHERWQILEPVTNTELNLLRVGRTSRRVRAEPAMLLITIKTAFGLTTKHIPVKEPLESQESQDLLRTVIQVLALKASSPMKCIPPTRMVNQLDHIVQCATPLQNSEGNLNSFSSLFTAIHGAKPETEISKHIIDANNMIRKVLRFLLEGRYDPSHSEPSHSEPSHSEPVNSDSATPSTTWGLYLWKRTKITLLVSGAVIGAGAACVLTGGAIVVGLLAGLPAAGAVITGVSAPVLIFGTAGAAGATGVSAYRKLTSQLGSSAQRLPTAGEYLAWLELAIEEASKWKSGGQPINNMGSPREPAAYEKKLVEQVEASEPEFKAMVEHSYCNINPNLCSYETRRYHDVKLRSPKFGAASSNLSPKQLLQRINIVVETHDLYKKVMGEKFVMVVGAEDAGKSTFIKEVIKKFGSPCRNGSEMPKVGLNYHTKDVSPYQVTEKLCLVDFPGGNGIGAHREQWQQFSMLPGRAILFLDFKDDLKFEQMEMYETMKESLGKNPIVVFNKVDERFTPEQDKVYKRPYFEEKRKDVATKLKCHPKHVYYMSVCPNEFQMKSRIEMMRRSGVDVYLETFADEVLDLRLNDMPSTFPLGY